MSVLCLRCGYPVTEPICATCVINEVKAWIYEKNIKKHIVKKIDNKFRSLLNDIECMDYVLLPSKDIWNLPIMQCNQCKKEMHLMCSYCVTVQASQIVKDNLRNESFIKNFNNSFNTNFYDCELNKENTPLLI